MILLPRGQHRLASCVQSYARLFPQHTILPCPIFSIQVRPQALPAHIDYVVFTSAAAVEAVAANRAVGAICVGKGTAKAAEKAGWRVVLTGTADGVAMAKALCAALPPAKLCHFHGPYVAEAWHNMVEAAGFDVVKCQAYDVVDSPALAPEVLHLLQQQQCIIPLYSPRSAQLFMQLALQELSAEQMAQHTYVPISVAAAAALPGFCHHVAPAHAPTAESVLQQVAACLS